ncbi:MAG TPA: hypothetical protein VEL76_08345 [Gemmataceae bacterium]|nr:hypothetical protein [Gemmataceae bacterium]
MNEAEWLACADSEPMLKFLRDQASERKLRLFALACCRRIDRLITDPRSRQALAFAEQYVEVGLARRKGRPAVVRAARRAWTEAYQQMFSFQERDARARCLIASNAADAAAAVLNEEPHLAASYAAAFASFAVAWGAQVAAGANAYPDLQDAFKRPEQEQQARLLCEVVGNPFRPPLAIPPSWRAAGMVALATSIYAEARFEDLPVLADALEEAGCTDANLLGHLRGSGPHARGCWAVDQLLGKA